MSSNANVVYLDSSAIVKLVVRELESDQLRAFLSGRDQRLSSALARVEVVRAVRPLGDEAVQRARAILHRLYLLRVDDELLEDASNLKPVLLRSLDAIHLAAAWSMRGSITAFVTYDLRLGAAAVHQGFTVIAPGASA